MENVPALIGHRSGETFRTILYTLSELGYCVEWMVHNSARFGVPQSRRRTYIVGYLGERNPLEILAFGTQYKKNIRLLINGGLQGRRVYLTSGDAVTQCSGSGGGGGKTGLYLIDQNPNPQITDNARCITARQDSGLIGPEGSGTLLNACLDVINGFLFGSLLGILIAVMMGYSVIKVFFANIKRGGILLIQIAIGSLYMFSVPRGFNDGFVMWVKQVIATCLTAFLQSTMLVCGLIQGLLAARLGNYARGGRNSEDRGNVRTRNLGTPEYKRRYQYGAVGGSPQADGYRRCQKVRGERFVYLSR